MDVCSRAKFVARLKKSYYRTMLHFCDLQAIEFFMRPKIRSLLHMRSGFDSFYEICSFDGPLHALALSFSGRNFRPLLVLQIVKIRTA